MNKHTPKIMFINILVCMVLLLGSFQSAFAGEISNVVFKNKSESFVFIPQVEPYTDDLFLDFKDVMPGDKLTQEIDIKNTSDLRVKIYMSAEMVTDKDKNLLNEMNLDVTLKGTENESDTPIYSGPVSANVESKLDIKKEWQDKVYLGEYRTGSERKLNVELTVPESLDNSFEGKYADVVWTFYVDEVSNKHKDDDDEDEDKDDKKDIIPDDTPEDKPDVTVNPDDPDNPDIIVDEDIPVDNVPVTGDNPTVIYVLIGVIFLTIIGMIVFRPRKA